MIHDRDAHRETINLLKSWKGGRRGIIHCFSGDYPMARQCIELGFYISIPGTVTFEKSEKLRSIVQGAAPGDAPRGDGLSLPDPEPVSRQAQ